MLGAEPAETKLEAKEEGPLTLIAKVGTEPQPSLSGDPANRDAMMLFRNALSTKGDAALYKWEEILQARICERFAPLGKVGAGVFLRLLREPGKFVSHAELAQSAGVKSRSLRVIKVYICRLRNGLAEQGLLPGIIKTGRHSYCLTADAVPAVVKMLI